MEKKAGYVCPVCSQVVGQDMIQYLGHVKGEIITKIKKDYPDWDEAKGICPQCKEQYRSWFDKLK